MTPPVDLPARFRVFAYGSLLFEPEASESLLEASPAILPGYRRTFNKISLRRATPVEESFAAFSLPENRFVRDGKNLSLALGTERSPEAAIVGGLQIYPAQVRAVVQNQLDRREGFSEDRPSNQNGYLRCEVSVRQGREGVSAITYLTNPDEACPWTIGPEIDLSFRAKILINATPVQPSPGIARGLDYLRKTREELASIGERDPGLEELARAVQQFDGPWQARVGTL